MNNMKYNMLFYILHIFKLLNLLLFCLTFLEFIVKDEG